MDNIRNLILSILFIMSAGANAASVELTLVDVDPGQEIQQVKNRPCVIGDNSCKNDLGYTIINNGDVTSGEWDLASPIYLVSDITTLMGGTAFWVGIDVNFNANSKEILDYFEVWMDGNKVFHYGTNDDSGPDLADGDQIRNGTGGSDFLLKEIDLAGLVLSQNSTIQFIAGMDLVAAGQEQFFLVRTDSPIGEVPLPAAAWFFITGLVGLAGIRKRGSTE